MADPSEGFIGDGASPPAELLGDASDVEQRSAARRVARGVAAVMNQQCGDVVQRLCGRIREQDDCFQAAQVAHNEWLLDRGEMQERLRELKEEMSNLREEIAAATAERRQAQGRALVGMLGNPGRRRSAAEKLGGMAAGVQLDEIDMSDSHSMDGDRDSSLHADVASKGWLTLMAARLLQTAKRSLPLRRDLLMIFSRYGRACGSFFRFYRFLVLLTCVQLLFHLPLLILQIIDAQTTSKCGSLIPCTALYGAIREPYGQVTANDIDVIAQARNRIEWRALLYVIGVGCSGMVVFLLAIRRWASHDFTFQSEQLEELVYPRRWSRLTLARWDFKLTSIEDRQNWCQAMANGIQALYDDELELANAASRTWRGRYALAARRFVGACLNAILIACAWAFIVFTTVRRADLPTARLAAALGGTAGPFGALAQALSDAAPNIAVSLVGAALPTATKAITSLEGWRPSVEAQHTLWRLFFGKFLNVVIVVIVNVELVAGRPLYGQTDQLLARDLTFSCVEDQAAATLVSLVLTEFVLTQCLKPILGLASARLMYRATRRCSKSEGFQKPEFSIPDYAVDLLYFQCLVWAASLLAPSLLLVAPVMLLVHFKWLKFALMHLSSRPITDERSAMAVTLLQLCCLSCTLYVILAVSFLFQPLPHETACGPFAAGTAPITSLSATLLYFWPGSVVILQNNFAKTAGAPVLAVVVLASACFVAAPQWIAKRAHRVALGRFRRAVDQEANALSSDLARVQRHAELLHKRLQWYSDRKRKAVPISVPSGHAEDATTR